MLDISCFVRRCMLVASVVFCFSVHMKATTQVINGNLQVTGTAEVKGIQTNRSTLILQKSSGTGVPTIDLKDSGGLLKGRLFANSNVGESGISLTTIGTNPIISIKNDGTVELNDDTAIIGNVEIAGSLNVSGDLQNAVVNKGDMSLLNTYSYTLGNIINFDQINDNPGNNISGIVPGYVVPVAGYYMVTIGLTSNNLAISELTLSSPICQIEIVQNNTVVFQAYQPIVTVGSLNHHSVTGIIRAQAGDVLQASYTAWAVKLDSSFGSVAGSVDLLGDADGIASFMRVHYLSTAVSSQQPL